MSAAVTNGLIVLAVIVILGIVFYRHNAASNAELEQYEQERKRREGKP